MSKSASIIISTSFVWITLIVLAIVMLPAALDARHSEHVMIKVQNKTNQPVRAALLCSNGDVFGKTLDPASNTTFTVFKGEFRDADFPSTVRVLILDSSGNVLHSTNHPITTHGTLMIERPYAFTVETADEGEIDVSVQLWSGTRAQGDLP